jgi:hypothetical protein
MHEKKKTLTVVALSDMLHISPKPPRADEEHSKRTTFALSWPSRVKRKASAPSPSECQRK